MEEKIKDIKGYISGVKIVFLLAWISLIGLLSALGGDTSGQDAALSSLMTPSVIRLLILFQAVLVFFLPIAIFIFMDSIVALFIKPSSNNSNLTPTSNKKSGLSLLTLGKSPRPVWVILGVLCMAASFPFVSWIGEMNAEMHLPAALSGIEKWMKAMETQSSKTSEILLNDRSYIGLILNLFTIAFVAAFSEELFFRAALQRTLTDTRINYHLGIWIAAFVFSAIHMQFFGFFPRLILGAILGYLFYFTENIWVSILAHFLNNGFVVVLGFFSKTEVSLNPLEKGKEDFDVSFGWPFAVISLIVVISLFVLLRKITINKKGEALTD